MQSRSLATPPYGLAIRWPCQCRSLDTRSASDSIGHAAAAARFSIHGDRRAKTLRLRKAATATQNYQPGSSRCALRPHSTRHHPGFPIPRCVHSMTTQQIGEQQRTQQIGEPTVFRRFSRSKFLSRPYLTVRSMYDTKTQKMGPNIEFPLTIFFQY